MVKNANEYMNIIYLNFGEGYEGIVDHLSYAHNLRWVHLRVYY